MDKSKRKGKVQVHNKECLAKTSQKDKPTALCSQQLAQEKDP